jgi:signal transduction histidine kinase
MPVRLRITILFVTLVTVILGILCVSIYYFSYSARIDTIKKRLTNRAKTTASLLAQKEIFDQKTVQKIDSLTTIALKNKIVQAYDYRNNEIYSYSDIPGDTLTIDENILNGTRKKGSSFLDIGNKEAVVYYYNNTFTGIVVVSAAEDQDGKRALHTLFNILLISFLSGNAIVLVAGYIFSARLLRPIKKITADVEEISAQSLARRIKTGTAKDEWHQLASTLNQLLNRLQESFELQGRFIANASHELSTPLTSISSQLEVSLQRDRDAKDYRAVMESIYIDVQHMGKLTQTLLEFAKASGSPGGLEINLVRIDEIILQLPAEMAKINSQYSVIIQFEKLPDDDESLLVFGNEPLLFTAIKNIVVNACKYSEDQKAAITLEIRDKIVISICDKGKGISKEELKSIFQPFYRVQENSGTKGFGLGLSLTEKIIKLHKGHIDVTSVMGKGTCFAIYIPLAKSMIKNQ